MNTPKKLKSLVLSLLFGFLVSFSLSACGGGSQSSESDASMAKDTVAAEHPKAEEKKDEHPKADDKKEEHPK